MGVFDDFFEKAKSFFGTEEETQSRKKCYYELLEVSRDATEEEIKKSFRKLALKFHPDKVEPERREETTALFVLLQQAYEVLSDPQERAFYDKHRENIIHGTSPDEKKDTGISLYPFFQKCYNGYGDDEDGFYTVYRQLFDKLAAEEYPYIDEDEEKDFPSFGYANSEYDQVVGPFYDHWSSFCTLRSFAWLDKYDLRQAPDRYNLKCMEKENKKLREQGRKQRNEEIRNLVSYMRKRDKRVQLYRAELDKRKQAEMDRVEAERRRRIIKNLERLQDVEVVEASEEHLEDLEKIENELDEQFGKLACDEEAAFYCIACEKSFKTAKALTNHEKSKKHKQAVEELRQFMNDDDQQLFGGCGSDAEEEVAEEGHRGKRKKKKRQKQAEPEEQAEPEVEEKSEQPPATVPAEAVPEQCSDAPEPAQKAPEPAQKAPARAKPAKKDQKRNPNPKAAGAEPGGPIESACKVCGAEFTSRSKLFAHINESGHAALKESGERPRRNRK